MAIDDEQALAPASSGRTALTGGREVKRILLVTDAWKPQVLFGDLVRSMVDADVQLLDDELSGRTVRIDR